MPKVRVSLLNRSAVRVHVINAVFTFVAEVATTANLHSPISRERVVGQLHKALPDIAWKPVGREPVITENVTMVSVGYVDVVKFVFKIVSAVDSESRGSSSVMINSSRGKISVEVEIIFLLEELFSHAAMSARTNRPDKRARVMVDSFRVTSQEGVIVDSSVFERVVKAKKFLRPSKMKRLHISTDSQPVNTQTINPTKVVGGDSVKFEDVGEDSEKPSVPNNNPGLERVLTLARAVKF